MPKTEDGYEVGVDDLVWCDSSYPLDRKTVEDLFNEQTETN